MELFVKVIFKELLWGFLVLDPLVIKFKVIIKLMFNDFKDLINNLIAIIAFIFNNLKQHLLPKIIQDYQNDALAIKFIF